MNNRDVFKNVFLSFKNDLMETCCTIMVFFQKTICNTSDNKIEVLL